MRISNEQARQVIQHLSGEFGTSPLSVAFSDIPEEHPLQGVSIDVDYNPCLVILRDNPNLSTVYHEFYHCFAQQKGLPNTENMADSFAESFTQVSEPHLPIIAGVAVGLVGLYIGWKKWEDIQQVLTAIAFGSLLGGVTYTLVKSKT